MAPPFAKKLKEVILTVGGNSWQCQTETVTLENNTDDPEQGFTLCPDGSYYEEPDAKYSLKFTALADWRINGLSRWLWQNDGATAAFVFVLHPDDILSAVHWTGSLQVKAPNAGGEGRKTEKQEITLAVLGEPVFAPGLPA
jgi:hypothetical protein